ncbi:MAG TPA: hypothetical protein VK625_02035 [Flavitalea sp.]|nr:hypothetical protein [Flavitalea sp.]
MKTYLRSTNKSLMNYEEMVKNNAGEMIEKLVTDVLSKDTIEIHFDFQDNEQWSVISMHIYEEDKEIALRVLADNRYLLYFGYYDDEDEFHEIIQPLSDEEKLVIPKGLQKAMEKVVADEQGLRLPGHFLSR